MLFLGLTFLLRSRLATRHDTTAILNPKHSMIVTIVTIAIYVKIPGDLPATSTNPPQTFDSYAFSLPIITSSPSVIGGVAAA
jgi:hypothetical protein